VTDQVLWKKERQTGAAPSNVTGNNREDSAAQPDYRDTSLMRPHGEGLRSSALAVHEGCPRSAPTPSATRRRPRAQALALVEQQHRRQRLLRLDLGEAEGRVPAMIINAPVIRAPARLESASEKGCTKAGSGQRRLPRLGNSGVGRNEKRKVRHLQ
jgi:hypothetical protein